MTGTKFEHNSCLACLATIWQGVFYSNHPNERHLNTLISQGSPIQVVVFQIVIDQPLSLEYSVTKQIGCTEYVPEL